MKYALSGMFLLLSALLCVQAAAQKAPKIEAPIIRKIEVEGLQRVEKDAILNAGLKSKVGDRFSAISVADDIKTIYKMGFFDDVEAFKKDTKDGVIVVFRIKEKPAVRKVKIKGNDEIGEDDIKKVIDIKNYSALDEEALKKNEERIKGLYTDKGYYLAEVKHRIIPVEGKNEVDVEFVIREHAKVLVKSIRFLNNEAFSDDQLKKVMETREGGWFSWLTSSGKYKEDAFERDMMRITAWYMDHGYINVKVEKPGIELSPDKNYLYLTVQVSEGQQYYLGDLKFKGDLFQPEKKLVKGLSVKKGELFNRTKLSRDLLRITDEYRDKGYANVNVTPLTAIDPKKKTVDITFDIQKGDKVYFEKIEVKGNSKTRDKVIRRELRIYEGDLYSATAMRRSRAKVFALGYFESVNITTKKGSSDDKVIATVEVKEKSTGTFQIGAGFSSVENFIFMAQIAQANFLGQGWNVALSAQLSSQRHLFNLRFVEPYLLDSLWTVAFDVFNSEILYIQRTSVANFTRASTGGDLTLGYPLLYWWTEDLRFYLTYKYEWIQVSLSHSNRFSSSFLKDLFRDTSTSSLRGSIVYDTRDNRLFPNRGIYASFSTEWADDWLMSKTEFLRLRAYGNFYYPLFWGLIFKFNSRLGWVTSLQEKGEPQGVPISERFFVGGINSVRGYDPRSLSPTVNVPDNLSGGRLDPADPLSTLPIGGDKEIVFNAEIEFPIIQQAGIRGVIFLDAGNAYRENERLFYVGQTFTNPDRPRPGAIPDPLADRKNSLPAGMYWSTGFGIRWFSPIGPLRFEWGIPLTKRPGDKNIQFEFTIGNFF
ncbi:MAG: outer membrane protein assembly factor BamA [Deltaproteobacteria bacterium]|nr:outer membrane protein assembly factor BamA [Deltaproteobacteria bacterium]